ncbi:Poly(A) RNA polymerase, mitochondrial [Anthophora quadrimaculata]
MALVHRVNLSFNPLLGTYYYKCMINIKRLKTRYNMKAQPEAVHGKNSTLFPTFEQMITFRQHQAKRTALVKIETTDIAKDAEKFCNVYGKVLNTFVYCTKTGKNFLLVEYKTQDDVENLKRISVHMHSTGAVNVITPLLSYKLQHGIPVKHNNSSSTEYNKYLYTSFTVPPFTKIVQTLKQEKNVSRQMVLLYETLKVTDLDVRLRFFTAHQISFYLSKLFTNISVVPFGSSVNGFGQLGCDLDLLCRIENNKAGSKIVWKKLTFLSQRLSLIERNEQKEFLQTISTIIEACIPGMSNIKKVLEARVPILKFFNGNTNMMCDLSCTNMVALYMSELLFIYAELDSRVKPLVCTIRTWARNRNLTKETSGHWITNFSLTLLIIFYLQTKNILPSLCLIESITEENIKSQILKPFSWFKKWKKSIGKGNTENLHELLRGFFEYYSIFDFNTQAICIREGIIKAKKNNSPLYIHNIFDTTLNVSKNVTVVELSRLINNFQSALQILDSSEEDIIIKLIKLEPYASQTEGTFKTIFLNGESHDNKQNENNSDMNDLKCINDEMLTNEGNTNVHENREKV